MKIRLDGDNILHDSFKDDMPIARFTDNGLINQAKRQFVHEHNYGVDMLEVFEKYGHNTDLDSVLITLKEMRLVFNAYRESEFYSKRLAKSESKTGD